MKLEGRTALVLGAGRSGRAAAFLLQRRGANVTLYDRSPDALGELSDEFETVSGDEAPSVDAFDCAIASPGVPALAHPKLMPEVDLAAIFLTAPLVGVTGTNGKSTTTLMIGEMLRASGKSVAVGGNIGTPLCSLVDAEVDVVVAELSSFQLENSRRLNAHVSVLLNLAEDHLDRHGDLTTYGAAKETLTRLQGAEDIVVANDADPWARGAALRSAAKAHFFDARTAAISGSRADGETLVLALGENEVLRVPRAELSHAAAHPVENALAAATAALAAGGSVDGIRTALRQFEGLEHRHRHIATRNGVDYVDDSKATNPAAAAASLQSETRPVWWLAGGRNKDLDFAPLASGVGNVREALLFGESREQLADALRESTKVRLFETLREATEHAARSAREGEVVLLAPACASFDQFESFEARGAHFAAVVQAVEGVQAGSRQGPRR